MSTRSTIYKHVDEDGVEIHIYEEMLGDSVYPKGFYVRAFVPHKFDIVFPISERIVKEITG